MSPIESHISSLELQAQSINQNYRDNTDAIAGSVDVFVGLAGGETVKSEYEQQLESVKNRAKYLLSTLQKDITNTQKNRLQHLTNADLNSIKIIESLQNIDGKSVVQNAISGVKGEAIGAYKGTKMIIMGTIDLAKFMVKYSGSLIGIHPEYKEKIDSQASQIYAWMQKEGMTGMSESVRDLIMKEMDRIVHLPESEQAEAIGNIGGYIISMLMAIKAGGMLGEKIVKMSQKGVQAERILTKLSKRTNVASTVAQTKKVEKLATRAKQIKTVATGSNIILNGVGESLIGYTFVKSLNATLLLIKDTSVAGSDKLRAISDTLREMENASKNETDPVARQAIKDAIKNLKEEQIRLGTREENIQRTTEENIRSEIGGAPAKYITDTDSTHLNLEEKMLEHRQEKTQKHQQELQQKRDTLNNLLEQGQSGYSIFLRDFDQFASVMDARVIQMILDKGFPIEYRMVKYCSREQFIQKFCQSETILFSTLRFCTELPVSRREITDIYIDLIKEKRNYSISDANDILRVLGKDIPKGFYSKLLKQIQTSRSGNTSTFNHGERFLEMYKNFIELSPFEKKIYTNQMIYEIHGENLTLLFEHPDFSYFREHPEVLFRVDGVELKKIIKFVRENPEKSKTLIRILESFRSSGGDLSGIGKLLNGFFGRSYSDAFFDHAVIEKIFHDRVFTRKVLYLIIHGVNLDDFISRDIPKMEVMMQKYNIYARDIDTKYSFLDERFMSRYMRDEKFRALLEMPVLQKVNPEVTMKFLNRFDLSFDSFYGYPHEIQGKILQMFADKELFVATDGFRKPNNNEWDAFFFQVCGKLSVQTMDAFLSISRYLYANKHGTKNLLFQELSERMRGGKSANEITGIIRQFDQELESIVQGASEGVVEQIINKYEILSQMGVAKAMYNYSSRIDFSGGKQYTIERFKKDVAIYNRLLNSPSTEMTQIVSQLYDQLVNLPNPEKFIENIENIFIRNNLPKVGKYFRIFEQLYPKKRLNELIMIPSVSPVLASQPSDSIRRFIMFRDLLKSHLLSGEPSLRRYLETLQESQGLIRRYESGEILPIGEQTKLLQVFQKLSILAENKQINLGNATTLPGDLRDAYHHVRSELVGNKNIGLLEGVSEYFLKPINIKSVDEALDIMMSSRKQADVRGRSLFDELQEHGVQLKAGELAKGFESQHMDKVMQDGFVARDFLGIEGTNDLTPFDIDLIKLKNNLDFEWLVKSSSPASYGDTIAVIHNRSGDIQETNRESALSYDRNNFELFKSSRYDGSDHYGIRTAFPSTKIDYLVFKGGRGYKVEELFYKIVKGGFYVPVVDASGKVIFSPNQFDTMRARIFSGINNYTNDAFVIRTSTEANPFGNKIKDLMPTQEQFQGILKQGNEIRKHIKMGLQDMRLALRETGDMSTKNADLIDTGSTGRNTFLPGSANDFDFSLKLNEYNWKSQAEIIEKIKNRLGAESIEQTITQNDYIQYIIKGASINNEKIDIDIGLTKYKTGHILDADEAVRERLHNILSTHGEKQYFEVIANIRTAKAYLKEIEVYKKGTHGQGGLGGIGVENWILVNGGSFEQAGRDFLKHALDEMGYIIPFEVFKEKYQIFGAGENLRSTSVENFVNNLTKEGYEKMAQGLKVEFNKK